MGHVPLVLFGSLPLDVGNARACGVTADVIWRRVRVVLDFLNKEGTRTKDDGDWVGLETLT